MKKSISAFLACTLVLVLTGCSTGNAPYEPAKETTAEESSVEPAVPEPEEKPSLSDSSSAPEETDSAPVFKVLTREFLHRTDQDGAVSSYYSPVYQGGPLYTGFERYTPDDVYLETVEERTYEINENERTLSWSPLNGVSTTTYVFDESGLLSEHKSIHSNGAKLFWYALTYDENGRLLRKTSVNKDGSPGESVWNYTYDESGNIIRCDHPDGAWTEYTYDEDGYPLTSISYDKDGEPWESWSSFEYVEISEEDLPEFMGSVKQWVLADLVY